MSSPSLPAPGDDDAVYLVDVSSFVFRAYHALPPLSNSKGEPTHAVSGVNQMLQRLLTERKPRRVIVAMDPKGPTFRHALFDKYKANRPEAPPDLSSQIEWVKKICEAWGFLVLAQPGIEADDLIASATKVARAAGLRVVIVSADKDLLQLVGDGVVMYDTMKNKVFGREETIERLGVPPEQVRDLLALVGDASDNVPGVPSVGPKTATKLLAEFGDVDGIYRNLDAIKAKGTREKLTAHRDEAYLSRELVTLKDDLEVGVDLRALRLGEGHPEELRALYVELELTRALAQSEPRKQAAAARYGVARTEEAVRALARALRAADDFGLYVALDREDAHRALVLGVALAFAEGASTYVPLMPDPDGSADPDVALGILRPLLENSLAPKHVVDAKREGATLTTCGVTLRGVSGDVGLLGYVLDPDRADQNVRTVARGELGAELRDAPVGKDGRTSLTEPDLVREHACEQADYALRLGRLLVPKVEAHGLGEVYRGLELPLVPVLRAIEDAGVAVDLALLRSLSEEATAAIATLEARCVALAGHPFNVNSPRQLETILFDEIGLRVVKKTKTSRSTDHEVLEELATEHDLPGAILEHRMMTKLKGTYLDALPGFVDPRTGRIHSHFDQTVAATGRLSSRDPNLQNIPIRTAFGQRIREAFVAPPGHVLLSADYSQIELRVLAHLSADPALVDAYTSNADVHARTASALFGIDVAAVDRAQRATAKTVNFAVIYGQTEVALSRNLKIDRAEARRYIEAFFARYAGVQRYLDSLTEAAREHGYVQTLFGRRRIVSDIHSRNPQLRMAAERVARNTPIQGTAADLIKRAMIAVHGGLLASPLRARMVLTVHDELVFEVAEDEVDALTQLVREAMLGAAKLDVPLEVSVGVGTHWGAAH